MKISTNNNNTMSNDKEKLENIHFLLSQLRIQEQEKNKRIEKLENAMVSFYEENYNNEYINMFPLLNLIKNFDLPTKWEKNADPTDPNFKENEKKIKIKTSKYT